MRERVLGVGLVLLVAGISGCPHSGPASVTPATAVRSIANPATPAGQKVEAAFTDLFSKYFAYSATTNTVGHCQKCHVDQATLEDKLMSSSSQQLALVNGHLRLVDSGGSILRWFSSAGRMPQDGDGPGQVAAAQAAISSWANMYVVGQNCAHDLCMQNSAWVCADPASDPANCGGCGNACAVGQVCTAGQCVQGDACQLGATQPCSVTGACGSGTQQCIGPTPFHWNECSGAAQPTCPPEDGWLADTDGTCFRVGSVGSDMTDHGGDGTVMGESGVPFETHGGAVKAAVAFKYGSSGGCFSSNTRDAIQLNCDNKQQALGQCETGAPPSQCASGIVVNDVGGHCTYQKIKGWTPAAQGPCVKHFDYHFKVVGVAKRCSW